MTKLFNKIIKTFFSFGKKTRTFIYSIYIILFLLYWIAYPSLYPQLTTSYNLIIVFFITIAPILWGIWGGVVILLSIVIARLVLSNYQQVEFEGGIVGPVVGVIIVLTIGGLTEYIKYLENRVKSLSDGTEGSESGASNILNARPALELMLIFVVCTLVALLGVYFDIYDVIYKYSNNFMKYQIDDLLVASFILPFLLFVFGYRRMRDFRREYSHHRKTESDLRLSELKYRSIVDHAYEGICIFQDGLTRFINPYAQNIMGYPPEMLINSSFIDFVHPDDRELVIDNHFKRLVGQDVEQNYPLRIIKKDQSILWVRVTGVLIDWDGRPAVLALLRDVTALVRYENELKDSLKEKNLLLKEIHHRVKNNMSVIISLLNLQAGRTDDSRVKEELRETQTRIRSMALIHETLYQSDNLAGIPFGKYVDQLGRTIIQAMSNHTSNVYLNVEADEIILDIDQATPCGLVLTELITNSLKHAFHDVPNGRIDIRIQMLAGQSIRLVFQDNGPGFPNGFDQESQDTMGMKLLRILIERQLGGTWSIDRRNRATIILEWPLENDE